MKRMLLTISYDGTAYHGWQVQQNAVTVQSVLCEALSEILKRKVSVTGTSRTDAGVHAKEFTCHFDCEDNIPNQAFLKGLNSVLPNDIAVTDCKQVANDFHARYNAKGKTYCYNIYNSAKKDPFKLRYAWAIERPLDVDKMNEFAKTIIGKHDFFAFSSSGRTVEDTVRTISECFFTRTDDYIKLTVTANGFLYNMVRIIVGTAVAVSDGKVLCSDIPEILENKQRERLGVTAPANALFLEKVHY
ncbi:MAG: tRNA pseudouridine(38-40) synthase TruA [Ruminococcaceae bacterium]|nr:tRNA pseudouridine(38-40) synthase TruA [Oscillospiraceae bacterium]